MELPIVACTQSAWGQAALAAIDAAFDDDVRAAVYHDYFGWIDHRTEDLVRVELAQRGQPQPALDRSADPVL